MPADSSHQVGQSVGARLRTARLAKKYTQQQLARPDFSVSYISAIERGQIQPSLRALEILAQRLELSTTDLLPEHPTLANVAPAEAGLEALSSDERELVLLEAQIAIYQKHPEQTIQLLQRFLPHRGERRQEKSSTIYYLLGWAYLEAGRLEESEQLLAEAVRLSRDSTDPLYPCILSLQNAVYAAMRNTEQAAQLQHESLRLLAQQSEAARNVFFLARLYVNLAQHAGSQGDFEQASSQLQQALTLLSQHNACQNRQSAYQQLLTVYASQESYQLATLYACKWLIARFRCRLPELKSELTYALGRILLRTDPAEARSYLEQLISAAEASQDLLTLAGARIQLASWSLARGELQQAEHLLNLVHQQPAFGADTLLSADAQLLAGDLAYRRQDYATGDSSFEAGLALCEKIGAEEDLVEHLAHYAQLLEERNCMQKSLFYWKLAYEQRKKNHMPGL